MQLEMLLMLKSESNVPRTSEQISQRLYVTERAAADQLVRLCRDGFLDCRKDADGLEWYQYKPVSPRLHGQVEELARDYAQRRVRLIEWLYSKPSSSVRNFAGAFRIRRSEDE